MSIFSLSWFKSRKKKEIEDLQHEIRVKELQKQLERIDNPPAHSPSISTSWVPQANLSGYISSVSQPVVKPYKNVKLINDVLTVVLNDGSIISKPNATAEDFEDVRNAIDESEIMDVVASQEVVSERRKNEIEVARIKALQNGIQSLKGLNDFVVEDNTVYLKGINRSLPQILVEEFIQIVEKNKYYAGFGSLEQKLANDEKFQSLKRFFMWCCLNPRAEVANELYRFLKENSFRITKQGFFVALRNVVTLHGSNELVQFVSNAYNKVKAVWKKSPADYEVYLKDGVYSFIHIDSTYTTEILEGGECYDEEFDEYYECEDEEITVKRTDLGEHIGNLTDIYLDLPNRHENRFTDDWTKTFDIRIGRVVNMPMDKCNWSTQDCAAAGLHFTSDQIHYVGCGDQSVLVLINPMKVVGIGEHKGRCYEYLPIMTVPRDEATSILHDLDFDTLALDEDYAIRELQNLAEKAKEGFVAETTKYSFNLPHISTTEIENIVLNLEDMKNEIAKRVVSLD